MIVAIRFIFLNGECDQDRSRNARNTADNFDLPRVSVVIT